MTRIIYLVIPLLMGETMGVVTSDHWGDAISIPEDKSEEIRETGFFPIRQIRPSPIDLCTCDAKRTNLNFGPESHPRVLVTNACDENCVKANKCREIPYIVNVSKFQDVEVYSDNNALLDNTCFRMWRTEARRISAACVPTLSKRQW